MKTLMLILSIASSTMAQSVTPDTLSQKEILRMYARLDSIFKSTIKENNNTYSKKVKAIKDGMVNASTIETLLPQSSLILSYTSFTSLVGKINNPTADGIVGSSFVDFIVEKASDKLIPTYPEDTIRLSSARLVPAKSRFKTFMKGLVQNPVFKSLMAATPITGVISNVLQQAASFEPNRELAFDIPTDQIRAAAARNSKTPVPIKRFISNNLGTGYTNTMLNEFFNEIKPRIEFYDKFNNLADSIDKVITEMKFEKIAISRQVQTSLTVICRTLNIKKSHFISDLDSLLNTKSSNQWLHSADFVRAVELSERAAFQLPQVRDFHTEAVKLSIGYIDGYIRILQGYVGEKNTKRAADAGLNQSNLEETIATLTTIRGDVFKYSLPN